MFCRMSFLLILISIFSIINICNGQSYLVASPVLSNVNDTSFQLSGIINATLITTNSSISSHGSTFKCLMTNNFTLYESLMKIDQNTFWYGNLFPFTTLDFLPSPSDFVPFSFNITNLTTGSLLLVKCGVSFNVTIDNNTTQSLLGRLVIPDKPLVYVASSLTGDAFACKHSIDVIGSPQDWNKTENQGYNWEFMSISSGKVGGRDLGDYDRCQSLPKTQFCHSSLKIIWTGYCLDYRCTAENVKQAYVAHLSEQIVSVANPEFTLIQMQIDQGAIDQELANLFNVSISVIQQVIDPITNAAVTQLLPLATGAVTLLATELAIVSLSTWQCGNNKQDPPPTIWIWAVPNILIVITAIVCSIIDYIDSKKPKANKNLINPSDNKNPLERSRVTTEEEQRSEKSSSSTPKKLTYVQMWSLQRNWSNLVSVRTGKLQFFDGIRFFSACWVILGHTELFAVTLGLFGNPSAQSPKNHGDFSKWWFQIIPGGFFAVDSFFWLAGFFCSFIMLKKARKMRLQAFALSIPLALFNRWLRLIPCILFVLGAYWLLIPSVDSGPLWPFTTNISDNCSKYWWTEVLFLVGYRSEWLNCMLVTWYLTCDFFYFACTPFIIILHLISPKLSLVTIFLCIVGCTYYNWYLSGYYRNASSVFIQTGDPNGYTNTYYVPWTRANPYLIGLVFGMIYDHIESHYKSFSLNFSNGLLLQAVGGGILLVCIFAIYDDVKDTDCTVITDYPCTNPNSKWSQSGSNFYNSFSRLFFGIGLSLMATAWIWTKDITLSAWFLSLPFLSPLGKLSFSAYLTHMFFVGWYYSSQPSPIYYSRINILIWWLGFITITFIVATFIHLFIEAPFGNMQNVLMEKIENLMKGKSKGNSGLKEKLIPG